MGNRNAKKVGRMKLVLATWLSACIAPVAFQMPTHYRVANWPKGLRIKELDIFLQSGYAQVKLMDGATLKPHIPLVQLGRFLNDHVQGAVENLSFSGGEGLEDGVLRLLDHMRVPGRLHTDVLIFIDFFNLPWAGIKRILDGRTLRTNTISFNHLQLPSGVGENELLKLPTVRECTFLTLNNLSLPQLPGPPPLFDNAALMEWLEQSDDQLLLLPSDYLSDGPLSFLNALKEVCATPAGSSRYHLATARDLFQNFQQATQVHSYSVTIPSPSINVVAGLGVRDEVLSNRLGETMVIKVGADPAATKMIGHPFEELQVTRIHPN